MRPGAIELALALALAACEHPGGLDAGHARLDAARDVVPADGTSPRLDATTEHDAAVDATPVDAGPPRRRVSISATGDIDITPRIVEIANTHRDRGRLEWVLARAALTIPPHDVAIADLETPLTTAYHPLGGRLDALGAPAGFAHDLSHSGLDVLLVANNHSYDQTADGLDDTMAAIRGAGMVPVGAGRTDEDAYGPAVIERDGVRVAVLGFTLRTNDGPGRNAHGVRVARIEEPARALAAVAAARDSADLVVVAVHWSRDFELAVNELQHTLARRLIDRGADLVLGTGPHVVQRVDRVPSPRGEAVIAYSLGDFVSTHGFRYRVGGLRPARPIEALDDPATRDGLMLRATFETPQPGTVHVVSLTGVALWTVYSEDGLRVVPLRATDDETRTERLRAITAAVGPAVRVRP